MKEKERKFFCWNSFLLVFNKKNYEGDDDERKLMSGSIISKTPAIALVETRVDRSAALGGGVFEFAESLAKDTDTIESLFFSETHLASNLGGRLIAAEARNQRIKLRGATLLQEINAKKERKRKKLEYISVSFFVLVFENIDIHLSHATVESLLWLSTVPGSHTALVQGHGLALKKDGQKRGGSKGFRSNTRHGDRPLLFLED